MLPADLSRLRDWLGAHLPTCRIFTSSRSNVLQTPVLLIVFNRPDTTRRVLREIAKAKPPVLLVAGDGPRPDRPDDEAACAAVRDVLDEIDWDCQVLRRFSQHNLGCGLGPESAISWAFEQFEEMIILEDDCLPHPSFFHFAQDLLQRYRTDERVMVVCGHNFLPHPKPSPYSYFFLRNIALWGWATWRRAWELHDRRMGLWPELRDTPWLEDLLGDPRQAALWSKYFERAHREGATGDYWDTQWTFDVWAQNGFGVMPHHNLVSNIGFGPDATHTGNPEHRLAGLPTSEMTFPLRHPSFVARDSVADRMVFDHVFLRSSAEQGRMKRALRRLRRIPSRLGFRRG